jgi:hypothetical protein
MNLSQITLVAITDENKYKDTIKAVDFSCKDIDFGDINIISNVEQSTNKYKHIKNELVNDLVGYNNICIHGLSELINTEFCLIIQWDGFIINPNLWTNDFLNYDYIGAPWDHASSKNRVGNGGFSLRSKKFLDISNTLDYNPHECEWIYDWQKNYRDIKPEDWFLCYESYEYMINHNIKFPSPKIASTFAIEYPLPCHPFIKEDINTYNSFGFHGHFNTAAMNLL